ncbi:MAG: hypothetical protein ACE5IW_12675 [bacterium]
MATMKEAFQAKEKMREILKEIPGINGIGITWDEDGQPCVRVNVDIAIDKTTRRKIPSYIDQVPVKIEVTGSIQME